jgi:hypothetical protein
MPQANDAQSGRPVPLQEFVEPMHRMISEAGENFGEPGLRIDVVELGGPDERDHQRRLFGAALRSSELPRLSADRQAAQRALGGVVSEADSPVVDEAGEGRPAREHVVDRLGDGGCRESLARPAGNHRF